MFFWVTSNYNLVNVIKRVSINTLTSEETPAFLVRKIFTQIHFRIFYLFFCPLICFHYQDGHYQLLLTLKALRLQLDAG